MTDTPNTESLPASHEERLDSIESRLDRGSQKMQEQAAAIEAISVELKENTAITTEVRELLAIGRNGLKVLGWIGGLARGLGAVATAGLAIYAAIYAITHNGQMPPK